MKKIILLISITLCLIGSLFIPVFAIDHTLPASFYDVPFDKDEVNYVITYLELTGGTKYYKAIVSSANLYVYVVDDKYNTTWVASNDSTSTKVYTFRDNSWHTEAKHGLDVNGVTKYGDIVSLNTHVVAEYVFSNKQLNQYENGIYYSVFMESPLLTLEQQRALAYRTSIQMMTTPVSQTSSIVLPIVLLLVSIPLLVLLIRRFTLLKVR